MKSGKNLNFISKLSFNDQKRIDSGYCYSFKISQLVTILHDLKEHCTSQDIKFEINYLKLIH